MSSIPGLALAAALIAASAAVGQAQEQEFPPLRSIWHVEQPLYEELLTDSPSPLASEGAISWSQMMATAALRPLAARHGWRYSLDEWVAEHGRRRREGT